MRASELLKGANLPASEGRIILSNCAKLEYDVVKSALERTFGETMALSGERIVVKEETAFSTFPTRNQRKFNQKTRRFNGTNTLRKDGNISRCARCGSAFHWVKNCPEVDCSSAKSKPSAQASICVAEDNDSSVTTVTYAEITEVSLNQCFGMGIIDTACTSTVCSHV